MLSSEGLYLNQAYATAVILLVLVVQLVYGGFMAGLRAAVAAPTWPDINGYLIPRFMNELSPAVKNFVYNPIAIHFIHRGLAYLLFVMILVWWFKSKSINGQKLFARLRTSVLALVILQVVLGILTVLNATHSGRLVFLGVAHQFTAMVLVMVLVCLLFIVRKKPVLVS